MIFNNRNYFRLLGTPYKDLDIYFHQTQSVQQSQHKTELVIAIIFIFIHSFKLLICITMITNQRLFFQDVEPGPGEHRLQFKYCFWYSRKAPGKTASAQNYDQNLKKVGTFASVCIMCILQDYLVILSHLTISIRR